MKRAHRKLSALLVSVVFAALSLAVVAPAMAATTVQGMGATFPMPLYLTWASDYKAVSGVQVNYVGIGSGGGIAAIKQGTTLFGATDAPLTSAEQSAAGLVQFPTCLGGVVPVVHIAGVGAGAMKLNGTVLAQIYRGQITKWNDSRIKALNPSIAGKLPAARITTVHRSDSSGTTWIFTHYINRYGFPWANKSGSWPVGIGGAQNAGVAHAVAITNNSIGYVEFAYAKSTHLAYTQLKNRSGRYVLPSLSSFTAAASKATWTSTNGFYTVVVDQVGTTVWPITGATFILMKKTTPSRYSYAQAHAALSFFNWGYTSVKGKGDASRLIYVSLPSSAVTKAKALWHSSIKAGGKAAW